MPAKKLNKKNCCFLYGEDLVSLALRREGLLKAGYALATIPELV